MAYSKHCTWPVNWYGVAQVGGAAGTEYNDYDVFVRQDGEWKVVYDLVSIRGNSVRWQLTEIDYINSWHLIMDDSYYVIYTRY